MSRVPTFAICLLACSALVGAQTPAAAPPGDVRPFVPFVVQQYAAIKSLLTRMVDKMPAEAFTFQPTPAVRTFAGSVGHLVMANINQCGTLLGKRHALAGQDLSTSLTTKTASVKVLAESFAFCDEYFSQLTDSAQLTDRYFSVTVQRDGGPVSTRVAHGGPVMSILVHNNEMYGYMAVYLRLKGIVPPSSEGRQPDAPRQQKPEQTKTEEPSPAGKWNLSVEGPQGQMTFGLTLKLDGNLVTGTLSTDQVGGTPLTGKYEDGQVSFGVVFQGGGNSMSFEFKGTLKDKDTLVGNLTGQMGEMAWTATRAKEK